jgi:Domain of unknown function (DUF4350)
MSATTSPTTRWRTLQAPAIVVALLIGVSLLLGLAASQQRRGFLDPGAVDRFGGRALARLLEDQGVRVEYVRGSADVLDAARPNTTLFVTVPWLVTEDLAGRLLDTGADIVLVGAGPEVAMFVPGTETSGAEIRDLPPRCALPLAQRAGAALIGGQTFQVPEGTAAVSCYPVSRKPTLIQVRDERRTITALGAANGFTNEHLDEAGNAALALGLLGAHRDLLWYRPVIETPPDGGRSISSLLPSWVGPVALQLFLAATLAAMWRARRLGPLVPEPLPVVVPAAEAERGRARLYRRGRSRAHAAGVLRSATTRRLRRALSMPGGGNGTADDVIAVAAIRTGRSSTELANLLAGPPPNDDTALVQLARDLDHLEREIRQP